LASAAFTLQERGEMLISSVRIKVNARRPPLDLQHYLRIC
jgi:hypothetical protein